MDNHVLHVGVRVDHMADGSGVRSDRSVLLSVEMVGKIEKLYADRAGNGREEGKQVGGDENATYEAKDRPTRREFQPNGRRTRKKGRSAS